MADTTPSAEPVHAHDCQIWQPNSFGTCSCLPDPREEPWEWHPDGPEAHALLEQVQDEEGGR